MGSEILWNPLPVHMNKKVTFFSGIHRAVNTGYWNVDIFDVQNVQINTRKPYTNYTSNIRLVMYALVQVCLSWLELLQIPSGAIPSTGMLNATAE